MSVGFYIGNGKEDWNTSQCLNQSDVSDSVTIRGLNNFATFQSQFLLNLNITSCGDVGTKDLGLNLNSVTRTNGSWRKNFLILNISLSKGVRQGSNSCFQILVLFCVPINILINQSLVGFPNRTKNTQLIQTTRKSGHCIIQRVILNVEVRNPSDVCKGVYRGIDITSALPSKGVINLNVNPTSGNRVIGINRLCIRSSTDAIVINIVTVN